MLQLNMCPTIVLQLQNSRTIFIPIFVPALSPLVFADSTDKSILVRLVGELPCKIIIYIWSGPQSYNWAEFGQNGLLSIWSY